MTVIDVSLINTIVGGTGPFDGRIVGQPWAGRRAFTKVDGKDVTVPTPVTVQIVAGVPVVPFDLEPSDPDLWCWKLSVTPKGSSSALVRYVTLPDSDTPIPFGDLVQVDPTSFVPVDPTSTVAEQLSERLVKSQNLADLPDKAAARSNLELGSAAGEDVSAFATAGQGTKADSAVQPGDLGSAATHAATDFATAAQGAKADTALQSGDMEAEVERANAAYATSAQGAKADAAVPQGELGSNTEAARSRLAFRKFRADLAAADSAPCRILTLTDSIGEGHGLSSYLKRWPHLLGVKLRARYQTITASLGYIATQMATGQTADWPVVAGGSSSNSGLGVRGRVLTSGTPTIVFSVSGQAYVDLVYFKGTSGGTFSWKIDSGSTTNIDTSSGAVSNTSFNRTRLTLPDTGAHTVTVQRVSGTVIFEGFIGLNSDNGITVYEGGHGGAATGLFLSPSSQLGYLRNQLAGIQPSLVILELGPNDFAGSAPVSAATFRTNLNTLVSEIKSQVTNDPSILLVCAYELIAGPGVTPVDPWPSFRSQMYDLAASDDDIAIYDLGPRIRPVAANDTARGMLQSTESPRPAHPTDAGAAYIADALYEFLIAA